MGNFGWDDIYEPLGGRFTEYAASARAQYRQGELLLRCPFSLAMHWDIDEQALGVTVSALRELPGPLRQHLEHIQQPLVLVGFGGLGIAIDPALFRLWPHHHFLMPAPWLLICVPTFNLRAMSLFCPKVFGLLMSCLFVTDT